MTFSDDQSVINQLYSISSGDKSDVESKQFSCNCWGDNSEHEIVV